MTFPEKELLLNNFSKSRYVRVVALLEFLLPPDTRSSPKTLVYLKGQKNLFKANRQKKGVRKHLKMLCKPLS
jgi:hypothetical protein